MKKTLFFVAIATLFIASCQKEVEPTAQNTGNNAPCFRASIEQLVDSDTKAAINGSNQLEWATGDKIGIWFPSWDDNNYQSFTLSGGAGTTEGTFSIDTGWAYNPSDATVAYFPWSAGTNMYEGNLYFELPSAYWSYDNGDMVTPLVASLSSSDAISFKHAGAAVKLTVNNLVSGTYAVKMSVYNKQISGYYHINAANAGTDAMVPNTAENTSLNNVTLNSWKSSGAFSWIFPVPELDNPKLKFEITDENGVPVWKKSLAAQANDVERGDILVMPAISITPYKTFDATATWGVCGTHNSWSGDTKMVTDGTICIAKSIEFAANAELKVRNNGTWGDYGTNNFGAATLNTSKSKNATTNGENIKVTVAGTYDVIFNQSTKEIRVVLSKYPYPLPKESASITIDGSFSDWAGVTSESAGNTTVKVVSDNTKVSVYVKITGAASDIWDNGGGNYVYALFDLDGDPSNDVDKWGNKGDFVLLLYPYAAGPAIVTSSASSATTWVCVPSTTPCTVDNISLAGTFTEADGDGKRDITYEFSIPRTDMPTIPSTDPITITIKGSKISSNVSISRTL